MTPWPIVVPTVLGVAAGIAAWGAFSPTSQLFGPTLRHTARRSAVALTFDDGPNPAVTPDLLVLLERHAVSATFFWWAGSRAPVRSWCARLWLAAT